MNNVTSKVWIFLIISGIITIISVILPSFIYINITYGDAYIWWIFAYNIVFDNGILDSSEFYNRQSYILIGSIYFSILIIIGIILIIMAIFTKKGKNFPQIGLILILFGIFLVLSPFLIRASFSLLDLLENRSVSGIFAFHYNSIIIFLPIMGTLTIITKILIKRSEH